MNKIFGAALREFTDNERAARRQFHVRSDGPFGDVAKKPVKFTALSAALPNYPPRYPCSRGGEYDSCHLPSIQFVGAATQTNTVLKNWFENERLEM